MKTLNDDLKREKEINDRLKALDEKKKRIEEKEHKDHMKKLEHTKNIVNEMAKEEKTKKVLSDEVRAELVKEAHEEKPKKKKIGFEIIGPIILLIASIANLIYQGFFNQDINLIYNVIYGVLFLILGIICLLLLIKPHKAYNYIISIVIIFLIGLPILKSYNLINLPTVNHMPNLLGEDISIANNWCHDNNITCNTSYEYSDIYKEYSVSYQSVNEGVRLTNITSINLVISNGPDYSKEVLIPDFSGMNIDDAVIKIKELYLNNIDIEYEYSDTYKKDTIISQNYKGTMARNTNLVIHVSYGQEGSLTNTKMIDLKNYSLFDATLFLKRNGLVPKIEYEYSDTVLSGYVIRSNKSVDEDLAPGTEVVLTISTGKKITIPDFSNMTIDQVNSFIANNHLKVKYNEIYSMTVDAGKVISADKNKGDIVSSGTLITINVSLGKLLFPTFNSLDEFRSWAANNNIQYTEEYEFNSDIPKSNIIKFSLESGALVDITSSITVYISNGSSIVMPNFYGMNKTSITNKCNELGLNCTFYNTESWKSAGTAVYQNKKAGNEVPNGTYVNIALSLGYVTDNTPPSCDRTQGGYVNWFFDSGDSGTNAFSLLKGYNPKFTFSVTYVTECKNGETGSGSICEETMNKGWITYCDTINVKIVK